MAEHLWHGTPKWLISDFDYEEMLSMGLRVGDLRIIWDETSRLVRRNKKKIWVLAGELLNGKRLKR